MRRILFIILFVLPFSLVAQKNVSQTENPLFKKASELLSKEKYGSASIFFTKYLSSHNDLYSSDYVASRYYKAYCDIKMKRPNSEMLMEDFMKDYPATIYADMAKKLLAYLSFSSENYSLSLDYFETIDDKAFKGDEKAEFLIKRAYCYMINNETEKAANDFYSIDPFNKRYKPYANFYYANIAYRDGNFQTALELFLKLRTHKEFASVVPYYIIQVYYMQKKFDKLIEMGPEYYNLIGGDRRYIVARILANAYFNKGDYKSAELYFAEYLRSVTEPEKIDKYEYGYSLYKLGEHLKATNYLVELGGENDLITQSASYALADCYIKLGDKVLARKALSIASSLDFDPEIKENALFNTAKINYELSYSPFNETLNSFDEYISSYPDSRRNAETYEYLVKVYMRTKNYDASLKSMDKIKTKILSIQKTYQRIAYKRAIQLFNNENYSEAIVHFNKSLKYGSFNNVIAADCVFWIAESNYKLQAYSKAVEFFDSFLLTPGATLTQNYSKAYYGLAYSFYQTEEYDSAIDDFRSFELQEKDKSSIYLVDARCRIMDYYLYERDYDNCISYCDKLIKTDIQNADYAYLKKATAYGLLGDNAKELSTLDKMLTTYPTSKYYSEACYQAGNVSMTMENSPKAKAYFNRITFKEKSFKYDAMAKLQLALIAFNGREMSTSESLYKSVITNYLGTDYAVSAKSGLKNVMVEINDVDSYYAYINKMGMQTNGDNLAKDSLVFAAAEKLYMDNKLTEAIPALETYVSENPHGDFLLTANYYAADAYYRENLHDKSLVYYEKVLVGGDNSFTLDAALHASNINIKNKSYNKAIKQFAIVERLSENKNDRLFAKWKILEANYSLENYKNCITEGEALLVSSYNIKPIKYDVEIMLAKAYTITGDTQNAIKYNKILAKYMKRKEGAEAKYLICKRFFDAGDYVNAEKNINEFMESGSGQYLFLAKSFILLADIFLKKDDIFQAKYTLMSIIENYPNKEDGLLSEAKQRLVVLQKKQKLQEASIKKKNAERKTKIEKEDFEKYRMKFEESEDKNKKAEENELENMTNTEIE
ncbi:MAG: tetratricopeptide repeat protein [Marinifilaceae bacterium]